MSIINPQTHDEWIDVMCAVSRGNDAATRAELRAVVSRIQAQAIERYKSASGGMGGAPEKAAT